MKTFAAIFLLLTSINLFPQSFWQQLNGPNEGWIWGIDFTTSGEAFLASHLGGVYHSTDNGLNWYQCSIDSEFAYSVDVHSSGNIIIGGSENYVSTDNGNTWQSPLFINTWGNVYDFFCFAENSSGVLFAGTEGGIFRSTDGGLTFDTTGMILEYKNVNSICIDNNNHIFAAADQGVIYKSTNNGASWENAGNGITSDNFNAVTLNKNTGDLYAGTNYGEIFHSTDNGASWNLISQGYINVGFNGLLVNSTGTLFAAGFDVFVRTTDNGNHWDTISTILYRGWIRNLTLSPSGSIFACTESGVYRSDNNGGSWTQLNNGLSLTLVTSLAINPSDHIYAGTSSHGLFRTLDKGASWTKMALSTYIINCVTVAPNGYVYAGTYTDWWHEGGVFRSMDNGNSWERFELDNYVVTGLGYNNLGHVFGGTNSYLYRTTDDGNSWHIIADNVYGYIYSIVQSTSGDMYIGTDWAVYKSTDNGATWFQTQLETVNIRSIVFAPNGDIIASGNGIWRSTDEGTTWNEIESPALFVPALSITPGGYLYAATQYSGIYRTLLDNINWTPINSGLNLLTNTYNAFILDSEGYLYTGSDGRSVFRTRNSTTDVNENKYVVKGFNLSQNYPNPFNPSTKIKYTIAKQGNVSLRVYDILGNEITSLVNKEQGPGEYEIEFNAESIASGIYFYQLKAGEFSETRKMVVVK